MYFGMNEAINGQKPEIPEETGHKPAISLGSTLPGAKSCTGPGESRASRGVETARLVCLCVCGVFDLDMKALLASGRGARNASHARQVAMYLVHTSLSWAYQDVAEFFGRDRTTVSHACRQIEDERDDPRFDTRIGLIEAIISIAVSVGGIAPASKR